MMVTRCSSCGRFIPPYFISRQGLCQMCQKYSPEIDSERTLMNDLDDLEFIEVEDEKVLKSDHLVKEIAVYEPDMINKKVWISDSAWADMRKIVALCPVEISWFGVVETLPDGICVTEIHMPEQIVNRTATEWNSSSVAKMIMDLERNRGIEGDQIRFWGHSHVNMVAQFSSHDRQKMAEFGGGGGEHDPEWFLNLVVNKSSRYQCIMEVFKPARVSIDIKPTFGHPAVVTRNWADEIRAKCRIGNVRHTVSSAHNPGILVKGIE